MNGSEALAAADILPRRSLRNIGLLAVCPALTQGSNTLMFASSALAVLTIVPADLRMWANLPITMQHLGVMLSVFPASLLMKRAGRRLGFRLGSLLGMFGASCAAFGLGIGSFLVMCLGGLVLGNAVANMQLYRFAAVEWRRAGFAPGDFLCHCRRHDCRNSSGRPGALHAGTLASHLPGEFRCASCCIHFIVFMRAGLHRVPGVVKAEDFRPAAALLEIVTQPAYMVAAAGGMIAFGVMSFVMAASPLAIVQCGLSKEEAPIPSSCTSWACSCPPSSPAT